jgi:lipopolysaccharide transport system ATP-binding protein
MSTIIKFENVYKNYPYYHHITGGIKNLIFNLPKAFRDTTSLSHESLSDISFEIQKGECVGFIGRNGAGKSTTLGLIAGVLKESKGKVTVNGRVSPLLELGGGFHPELTGRENIILNGVLLGLTRKQVKARISQIIDFSELGDFIDHPVRTYSSGMYARLGFSIVAHLDPEILLIDEVLSVGDASFQKKCIDKINEFKKNGVTIVLVSHSLGDIRSTCDRVIWIEEKKVKMDSGKDAVISEYENFLN